ncbi:serine/threonine-protein kinase [Streptomyces sp. MUM 178J]|uniref:serine/threonine-protein kinase n=1 Tax=Streptomyces sp. MUM 178J TaxID=2791991 RepID=UPI002E7BDDAD|nr:serine/threonine-protein kinase [Streptomyces sp. MUM 178J]WRQ82086.1 serine/threonine-protein kinase [Streptomyces sp. MUM 178J]
MPPRRSTEPVETARSFPEAEPLRYAGQYRLEACLGNGGMGVVHRAASDSGLRLAVKVIHAEHASDPEFRARFRQEVTAARRVSGAFTASVVDADPEAERPWMATLFIDGPTLAEQVKRNGPLGSEQLRRLGAGLAEALRDIHRAGVVHRDLKPGNVLLAEDGPKVIDFGISRPADSELRTETGKLIGTPPFMAPEQFQRPREVGPAADVFAMGAVLVHAATGRGPFDSDSPYIVAYQVVHNEPDLAGVPAGLAPLLRRCLAKDPAERPTPGEVMVALRAFSPTAAHDTQAYIPAQREPDAAGDAGDAGDAGGAESGGPEPAARRRRRSRWAAAAAAAFALGAAGAVALATLHGDGGGDASGGGAAGRPSAGQPAPGKGLRPWSVPLGGDGEGNRTPVCSGSGDALYCASPGVKAARLSAADGRVLWSLKANGGAAAQTDEDGAPVRMGGLLLVAAPGGGRLEALAPESGAVRWQLETASYATVEYAGDDTVLLVTADGLVRALDAATGRERWARRHGGVGTQWTAAPAGGGPLVAATPAVDGASTLITAVDPVNGDTLWQRRAPGALSPAGLADSTLFLLAADKDGFTDAVVRLDVPSEGRDIERIPLTAPLDQAQAAVVDGTVYLSGAGGSLLAVRGEQQLWRRELGVTHLSRPAGDGNGVYVSAGDGRLLAVDAGSGVLLGQTRPRMADGPHTFPSVLPAPVTTGPDRIAGTAPDGSVFAQGTGDPGGW